MASRDCILCGVGANQRRPWAQKYRAIYTVLKEWDAAKLSLVTERQINIDVVPLNQDFGVDVTAHKVGDDWVRVRIFQESHSPRSTATPLWGYSMHDVCWNILCSINSSINTAPRIQALFELCRSQSTETCTLYWDHTYGNLLIIRDHYPGEYYYSREPSGAAFHFASGNPTIPGFGLLENDGPEPSDKQIFPRRISRSIDANVAHGTAPPEQQIAPVTTHESHAPYLTDDGVPIDNEVVQAVPAATHQPDKPTLDKPKWAPQPVEALPGEMLMRILELIPDSADIASFLQASAVFAKVDLPPQFWKSRFLYDNEFAYLYPLIPAGTHALEFKKYYLNAMANQESSDFQNRRRIWDLGINLSNAIELRSEFKLGCPGAQTSDDGLISERTDTRWLSTHANVVPFQEENSGGARLLYHDELRIQDTQMDQIWVSHVTLHDGKYISGFQFAQSRVGYDNPKGKTRVTWQGCSGVPGITKGFYVAVDQYSLRSIRVYCDEGGLSDWVGEYEGLTKQAIAFERGSVRRLRVGMDAQKVVSLSLSKHPTDEARAEEPDDQHWTPGLWFPEVPNSTIEATCLDHPDLKPVGVKLDKMWSWFEWTPFYYSFFGGTDGSRLPQLQHINFELSRKYIDECGEQDGFEAVYNIIFSYQRKKEERDSETFGFVSSLDKGDEDYEEIRMNLDAINGERITAMDGYYSLKNTLCQSGLVKFQVPNGIESRANEYTIHRQDAGEKTVVGFYGQNPHQFEWRLLGLLLADLS